MGSAAPDRATTSFTDVGHPSENSTAFRSAASHSPDRERAIRTSTCFSPRTSLGELSSLREASNDSEASSAAGGGSDTDSSPPRCRDPNPLVA